MEHKAIKWLGPPTYTDFGRVETGDIINIGLYGDLEMVAQQWVDQGAAEWYSEDTTAKKGKRSPREE
jgi:hypothetical protein